MYRVATFLVKQFWREPSGLADGIGVLLLTWNQAFYRYGAPDFKRFEGFLSVNRQVFDQLRSRDISTFTSGDQQRTLVVFESALEALAIAKGKKQGHRSPVGVAKALHLLAPSFFPLWDKAIADAYGCGYSSDPAGKYVKFMGISKTIVAALRGTMKPLEGKTHLKVFDEYNYAKFTKQWV